MSQLTLTGEEIKPREPFSHLSPNERKIWNLLNSMQRGMSPSQRGDLRCRCLGALCVDRFGGISKVSEVRKCPYEPEVNCLRKHCDLPKLVTFLEDCWIVKDEKAKRRNKTRK